MIGFPECFITDVAEFTLEIFPTLWIRTLKVNGTAPSYGKKNMADSRWITELTAGKPVTDHSAGRILGRAFSDVRHKEGKKYGSSRKGNTGHKIRE